MGRPSGLRTGVVLVALLSASASCTSGDDRANGGVGDAIRNKDAIELACVEGKGWSTQVDDATNPIVLASSVLPVRRGDFVADYFACVELDEAAQRDLRPLMLAATDEDAAEQRMLDRRVAEHG